MAETYVKTFTDPDEATAEAAGLEWLAEAEDAGGTRIARVLAHPEPRVLHLEQISEGAPTSDQAERFGRSLAHTHAAGAPHWGAPSPGFPQPGSLRMGRSRTAFVSAAEAPDTWGEFFAEYRIRDYVHRIVDQGGFDGSEAAVFERVAERLEDGEFGSPQPALVGDGPARLHGDLWAGNVLWPTPGQPVDGTTPTGAVLIDANPHRGHAETDLALRASSYGLVAWAVDGMDVLDVEDAARRAAEAVRGGGGPHFLEMRTYRFRAHSMYDSDRYREKAEIAAWKERDPIDLLSATMRAEGQLDDVALARIETEVGEEIDRAVASADAAPFEPVEELTRFVHSEPVEEVGR